MPNNLRYIRTWWLVGGTSIACSTIYSTYTWCLVSCMPDKLRSHCQLDEQPRSRVDGQQRRQTKEEKGQIKKTDGNCERKRSKVSHFGIYPN